MSIRIIAGEKRGAVLKTPPGNATRPTLGRVRESLFMILQQELPEARVLDLFAGSGALGIEALSRGALFACFVESARPAQDALRYNLEKLGFSPRSRIITRDVLEFLKTGNSGTPPYHLVLADPPYQLGLAATTLEALADPARHWVEASGTIVLQVGRRDPLPAAAGLWHLARQANYGETRIGLYTQAEDAA